MRKLMRSIARHNMEKAGIEHLNKRTTSYQNGRAQKGKSVFALKWREYLR